MFNVYILQSKNDGYLYTGFTADLKKRLKYHNEGFNHSTKSHRPMKLIYFEGYCNEKDARRREKFLKSGRGREIIKKQLEQTLNAGIV